MVDPSAHRQLTQKLLSLESLGVQAVTRLRGLRRRSSARGQADESALGRDEVPATSKAGPSGGQNPSRGCVPFFAAHPGAQQ